MHLIRQNKTITRDALSTALEITQDGVKYHIANLKKKGLLKRIGSKKSGYWKIMKK